MHLNTSLPKQEYSRQTLNILEAKRFYHFHSKKEFVVLCFEANTLSVPQGAESTKQVITG
jgi:hypothetical protein